MNRFHRDMSIGERIRVYRRRRGLSQLALAQLVGRSESWLSQVERGRRSVDRLSIILQLAEVLRIDPDQLTSESLTPRRTSSRRDFDPLDRIRGALLHYPALEGLGGHTRAAPPNPFRLRGFIGQANRRYQAGYYSATGRLLPALIAQAQAATEGRGDESATYTLLAHTYHVTAKILSKVSQTQLAWVVAERAMNAAERAGEPVLMGVSAYHLAQAFLQARKLDDALTVSDRAATALATIPTDRPESVSLRGALRLVGVIAAARANDRGTATALLKAAATTADELLDDRNDHWTAFGPINVRIHAVSVATELGDATEAVRLGEDLDTSNLPDGLVGRRAQVLMDVACGYAHQRLDAAAVNTLLEAEQAAPEALRYNLMLHGVLSQLLGRAHRATTPQLRRLAARIGVLAA